jgi:hypothetical protein
MATLKLSRHVPLPELRTTLARTCPDLDLQSAGPGLTASQSRWVAAWVLTQRNQVQVVPMVRSLPMMLALLAIMLTGLGLLIYAVAVVPKQQAVVKRVTAALERELRATP